METSINCEQCGEVIGVDAFVVQPDEEDPMDRSKWRFFHLEPCWPDWAKAHGVE